MNKNVNFTLSDSHNINYLASIVKINELKEHPDADNLAIATIFGNDVIVTKGIDITRPYVYVPVESKINADFLHFANMYEDKNLNADTEQRGYINNKGRVRAIKLRGVVSKGLIIPLTEIINWSFKGLVNFDVIKQCLYYSTVVDFDTVNGNLFLMKYEPPKTKGHGLKTGQSQSKKEISRMVEGQFYFHKDTPNINKSLERITNMSTNTDIIISKKYHGTSGIAGYLLHNKDIGFFKRLWYKFRNIPLVDYEYVASSRTVIRKIDNKQEDTIWTLGLKHFQPYLVKGMTIYYEAVGYNPGTNTCIQSGYDYGCAEGEFKFLIYRITDVDMMGNVREYTANEIINFAIENNLLSVYHKDSDSTFYIIWPDELQTWLGEKINNCNFKIDDECKNKVPFEGYCFRIESDINVINNTWEVYKFKTDEFLLKETKELDKGVEILN